MLKVTISLDDPMWKRRLNLVKYGVLYIFQSPLFVVKALKEFYKEPYAIIKQYWFKSKD